MENKGNKYTAINYLRRINWLRHNICYLLYLIETTKGYPHLLDQGSSPQHISTPLGVMRLQYDEWAQNHFQNAEQWTYKFFGPDRLKIFNIHEYAIREFQLPLAQGNCAIITNPATR